MQAHQRDARFWIVLIGVGRQGSVVEKFREGLTALLGVVRSVG